MSRRWQAPAFGAAVLLVLVGWAGVDPFVDGVRALDVATLALGFLIAVPTTVACAWRWHLVAGRLGVAVGVRSAVAACYRAQFLNVVLPGGVLGDVHRGLVHGREAQDTPGALRAVGWERLAGQVVQGAIAFLLLLFVAAPAHDYLPIGGAALAVVLMVALASVFLSRIRRDVVQGLLAREAWPGIVLASVVAVAGYAMTFVLAARATGVTTPVRSLLPVVMLVLVVGALPLNLAGWGPREGMTAWGFGATGIGADQGLETATAYGVIVLVASLPGALVLLTSRRRRSPEEATAG